MTIGTATEREERFIFCDVTNNNNKWWNIRQNGSIITTFNGRVGYVGKGSDGANAPKDCGTVEEANKLWDKLIREKTKKGYVPQKTIPTGQTVIVNKNENSDLKTVALKQIESDSPETAKLVEYLVKQNAHNVSLATGGRITYNFGSGLFQTPLGIVTKDGLDEARQLLGEIAEYVAKTQFSNSSYHQLLNDYLKIVPQNVGMKLNPETLYPDLESVQNQNSILDSLEASLDSVLSAGPGNVITQDAPKIFDVRLKAVSRSDERFQVLRDFYRKTLNYSHTSSRLDVKDVWELEIGHMQRDFESFGKQLGNIKQLWHGTKVGNLLSIMKSGYIIPPSSSSHVTGRMFGDGIYFSDQSTKSLNYASGYWGGTRDDNCFMLLNSVAMGKEFTPRGPTSAKPPAGYDSYFAKAGQSGVMNNEMIVFKTSQVAPKFLLRFSPSGK